MMINVNITLEKIFQLKGNKILTFSKENVISDSIGSESD